MSASPSMSRSLGLAVLIAAWVTAVASGQSEPEVIHASRVDVSPPLWSFAPAAPVPFEGEPVEINPLGAIPRSDLASRHVESVPDWALQETFSPTGVEAIPVPTLTFEGINNLSGVYPPDTTGDVGPRHYVQMVNSKIAVYRKSDGAVLLAPVDINSLWSGFGGNCQNRNDGDPIVLYDQFADRWMVSQFSLASGNFRQCIAISTTSDPTGSYYRYDFQWSTTKCNDYPHFGVWPDGYYMTVNQFNNCATWGGAGVGIFERDQMLKGATARLIKFDIGAVTLNFGGMLPVDLDGTKLPPDGTPNFASEWDDSTWLGDPSDTLRFWRVDVDWVTPANSTFGTGPTFLPNHLLATANANPINCPAIAGQERPCIPQPSTAIQLDAIGDGRLMFRMPMRIFGAHESTLINNTVGVGGSNRQAAPRWYEIRGLISGSPIIQQQGTYAPDSENRWMASLAMDNSQGILLGYSLSSSATFPSMRYTGRVAGDALGTMPQGEAVLIAGTGSQTGTANRWGDYSTMSVDPVGECSFWYTNEYIQTTGGAPWRTRVGTATFSGCVTELLRDGFEGGSTGRWPAQR